MSSLVLSGDTSGSITIAAPAVSGTTTITLPTVSGGNFVVSDSSGNVGIGTTSPTNALTVNGSGRFYGSYTEDTTNTGIHAGYINSTPRMGFFNGTSAQNWQIDNDSGNFRWFTPGVVRMQLTSAGLLQFNSGYGSVATAYGCRAWVNFNGTGTVAIRASGNVTSITDNGVGSYTVNFTTAMPDVNYGIANGNGDISWGAVARFSSISTNNFLVETTGNSTTSNGDCALVCVSIFR